MNTLKALVKYLVWDPFGEVKSSIGREVEDIKSNAEETAICQTSHRPAALLFVLITVFTKASADLGIKSHQTSFHLHIRPDHSNCRCILQEPRDSVPRSSICQFEEVLCQLIPSILPLSSNESISIASILRGTRSLPLIAREVELAHLVPGRIVYHRRISPLRAPRRYDR